MPGYGYARLGQVRYLIPRDGNSPCLDFMCVLIRFPLRDREAVMALDHLMSTLATTSRKRGIYVWDCTFVIIIFVILRG